ncbi:MAG TPA: phosphotransferase [Ilumatobacteraceae bacterium]|nr:phosphotransferase [Ilumatobacteraceae bacterium]
MATPVTIADIDAAWLAGALDARLDSIDVHPIAAGEGFMGQLARVTIASSDPGAPCSVIVKLPTSDPGGRAIGEMMRVWEREHCFYRDIAPDLQIRVPHAYVNTLDPPCLVLEDLAPAVAGDHLAGATREQAEQSIDLLARLHGAWFEHASLESFAWMPGLDDPAVLGLGAMFEVGWPVFLERYGDELPQRCLRWCEQFVPGIPTWIQGHENDPVTLIHGDFRLDNLFFADDGSVAVVDWQLSMRAPGQTDLVYFCANNLTVPARREFEDELIERYVRGIHAAGVGADHVTLEGVRRGYVEGMLFYAVSFGASLLTIDPANARGAALFDELVRRTFAAVDDLDSGSILGF